MAAKSKASKSKKVASKKAGAKKTAKVAAPKRAASRKSKGPVLTDDQRRSLLRPVSGFEAAVARLVETWGTTGKALRVTNRSPAQLNTLLKKALKAADRESDFLRVQETKLRPLTDARLLAMHELWRGVLDVYGAVRGVSAPDVQSQFEFLSELFARGKRDGGEKKPEPTEG